MLKVLLLRLALQRLLARVEVPGGEEHAPIRGREGVVLPLVEVVLVVQSLIHLPCNARKLSVESKR